MTKEEYKEILKEVLLEHHDAFYVEAEKHYQHHQLMETCKEIMPEWEKNHAFISDVRRAGDRVKEASIIYVTRTIWAAFIGLLGYGIYAFLKGHN